MKSKIKENLKKILLFSLLSSLGLFFLISLSNSDPQNDIFVNFSSSTQNSENIFGIISSLISEALLNIFGIS